MPISATIGKHFKFQMVWILACARMTVVVEVFHCELCELCVLCGVEVFRLIENKFPIAKEWRARIIGVYRRLSAVK